MMTSLFSGFYKQSVSERLRRVSTIASLTEGQVALLEEASPLTVKAADYLIENVIGVHSLPLGVGLNFVVNDVDRLIPMVVEEPSIVAGVSSAAKLARTNGGFQSSCEESLLMGQVQVVGMSNPSRAAEVLFRNRDEILMRANSVHPRMTERGGGVQEIEVGCYPKRNDLQAMVVVRLLMDTCDAMGANLVNTVCERIAPFIEHLTGGQVLLRILSNLTDRSVVRAVVRFSVESLRTRAFSGEQVRDGVVAASQFAEHDPYRAATHNKGIMNGIDAVALATGNDWRAIEAGAHAFASRSGQYAPLAVWKVGRDGALEGEIEIPLKVGTVGAQVKGIATVPIAHCLLGSPSAKELAEIMAAVGLAQNFAALRALVTEGIGRGHLALHARSVAMAAGAPEELICSIVQQLLSSGEVKIWKAQEILRELEQREE